MVSIVYCPNFKPIGHVYQPLWKRQIAITRIHVRARWINNSLLLPPKFMKFLPNIKHHRSSMPQNFHFIWSHTTAVMKKTNATSIENLIWKIYFYSDNIKLTHDILLIQCIENFTKIPKSHHLLFYEFSMICYAFSKFLQNHHKTILAALFIWVNDIAVRPLRFFKLLPEVLDANQSREVVGGLRCRPEGARRRRLRGGGAPGNPRALMGPLGSVRDEL
jgi:hypothetical protein